MDMEEEMFEEHLDEEYQNSEIDEAFAEYQKQIEELERTQLKVKHDREVQKKLEKAITLLRIHLQNYQRIIIFNRRRARQRLKRRQCTLRNFYLQSLLDMQIQFVEMFPLAVEPRILMELKHKLNSKHGSFSSQSNETDVQPLNYYKEIVINFTDTQWLAAFHMPRNIFHTICSKLKPLVEDQINMDFESWLAMCIYTMANGGKFSSVGMLFNEEKRFVRYSLYKFVEYILQEFSEYLVSLPNDVQDLEKIAKGFHRASNLFPCVGVVHIFELPNQCSCKRFKNCDTEHVIVQVCIDDRLLFRKVEIANPNITIFLSSNNEISCIWNKVSEDSILPFFVLAPPQFPLRTWLMQKYDEPQKIWEHNFNRSFDNLNIFREVSMKSLFGRWQILCSTECIPPDKKSLIIKASCLLHNLLEKCGESVSDEWCQDINLLKYEHKIIPGTIKHINGSKSVIETRDEIAKLIGLIRNE